MADGRRLSFRQRPRKAGRPPQGAGHDFTRNTNALTSVQPEDVLPGDIDAGLVRPGYRLSDIQAFAAELFRVAPSAVNPWRISSRMPSGNSTPTTLPKVGRRYQQIRHRHGLMAHGYWTLPLT